MERGPLRSFYTVIGIGAVTLAVLHIQHAASGGCGADTRFGRDTPQISDKMCCPVGREIGRVGFLLQAAFSFAALTPPKDVARALTNELGAAFWCCGGGVDAGSVVFALAFLNSIGVVVLSAFDLCWRHWQVHQSGAILFFLSGAALVFVLSLTRRTDGTLAFRRSKLKPLSCLLAVAAVPSLAGSSLVAEWLGVVAIALAAIAMEMDVRRGTEAAEERQDSSSKGESKDVSPSTTELAKLPA